MLITSGVIYLVGSLIQCIVGLGSSESVALSVFYFSRFFAGIGVGMVSALIPSYVSECVPKEIRGRCTGMIQFANNIGIMLSCEYFTVIHIVDPRLIPFASQSGSTTASAKTSPPRIACSGASP